MMLLNLTDSDIQAIKLMIHSQMTGNVVTDGVMKSVTDALEKIVTAENAGKCGSCKHREPHQGYCMSDKLQESWAIVENTSKAKDMLTYPYSKGGLFFVGPEFGCVHWEEK